MTLRFLFLSYLLASVVRSQMVWHRPPHAAIQQNGNWPVHPAQSVQPVQPIQPEINERVDPLAEEKPRDDSPVDNNLLEPPKVIIRLASEMKPPVQKLSNVQPQSEGCDCESLNDCPIEMMNFAFGVSCPYGTVRCCRPAQPMAESEEVISSTEDVDKSIDIVTPVSVQQMPTTTPTPLTERPVSGTEILGNNQFRPVNLPFMKVPASPEHPMPTFQRNPPFPTQSQAMPPNAFAVMNRPIHQQFVNAPGRFQHPIPLQQSVTPTSFPTQQLQTMGFKSQQPGQFNSLHIASQPSVGSIPNQQPFLRPPPPPSQAVMTTLFQQRPPQQPQSSGSGGFFSSLMNMFSK